MTVLGFRERLAWMLRGFRVVAQTLSLTEKCHPDHLSSQLTKKHILLSMFCCCCCCAVFFFFFFFFYHVWILCLDVLTIKLVVVNLRSYGGDLWSNKNDKWYGQNPVISQKKH